MWKMKTMGGADYKILIINSVFISFIVPNAISGQFIFIMILGIVGILYGITAKLISRKKEIPFIPIITISYILTYLLWTI